MIILLSILNLFDYIITLVNRNNFEEANPIGNLLLQNIYLLSFVKLMIIPLFIYLLYRYRHKWYVKLSSIALCSVYLYAVVVGVLYLIVNIKMGVL